jgi:glycosyltransferase involved in cell wall biosynthesis
MHRVLHVINSLNYGGAEYQLLLNLTALDRSLYENYVCCVTEEGILSERVTALGIPVFSLNVSGKPGWLRAIRCLSGLIRSLQIDLVHTSLSDADIIGGVAGRLCRVPVVSTLCNVGGEPERLIDDPHLNRLKLAAATRLWGLALGGLHCHSIATSHAVKESAINTYRIPRRKLTVIHRALSEVWTADTCDGRTEELKQSLNLAGAYPVLLNVARCVPQKGQRYLIQAMPAVLEKFPRARLLVAGDGPLSESLAALSRELGVAAHTSFLGRRDDVKDLHRLSDIFAFPSLFEGCPNALMEAMVMGKPCVASCIGPTQEVMKDGDTGLLVPPQSPEAMAEAILRLSSDRQLARSLGLRARQLAQEKFTIARTIKQLEAVYGWVLCGEDGAGRCSDGPVARVGVRH